MLRMVEPLNAWFGHLLVAAVVEEVVYEVVAELQAPLEQVQQQETLEHPAPGPVEPSPKQQQPEDQPWCMSYYFKL
jgi:hypothetical protein